MSDQKHSFFDTDGLLKAVRQIMKEEIKAALQTEKPTVKGWLKAQEAAQLYGLPKTWFEERGRAGDIERTKPGRYVLFNRRDIERYLHAHKQKKSLTPTGGSSTSCRYHDQGRAEGSEGATRHDAEGVGRGVGDANQQHLPDGGGNAADNEDDRA